MGRARTLSSRTFVRLQPPELDGLPFDARTVHKLRRAVEYRRAPLMPGR